MPAPAEHIFYEDIEYTTEVNPNGSISVSANIYIEGNFMNPPPDPDYCIPGDFTNAGVKLINELYVNGVKMDERRHCWPYNNRSRRLTMDAQAPSQEGTAVVELVTRTRSDGVVVEEQQFDVLVSGDAITTCPTGFVLDPQTGNCVPSGDDGDGGDGGGDSPADQTERIVRLGVLGLGAIAIIRGIDLLDGD